MYDVFLTCKPEELLYYFELLYCKGVGDLVIDYACKNMQIKGQTLNFTKLEYEYIETIWGMGYKWTK